MRFYSYHKVLPAPKLSFLGLDATKFLLLDKIHELRSYFQKTVTKAGIYLEITGLFPLYTQAPLENISGIFRRSICSNPETENQKHQGQGIQYLKV